MFHSLSVKTSIYTSNSWYFDKIYKIAFQGLEKKFSNDFALFWLNDCQHIKNNCAKQHQD